jgi:hypothetical protein
MPQLKDYFPDWKNRDAVIRWLRAKGWPCMVVVYISEHEWHVVCRADNLQTYDPSDVVYWQ